MTVPHIIIYLLHHKLYLHQTYLNKSQLNQIEGFNYELNNALFMKVEPCLQ